MPTVNTQGNPDNVKDVVGSHPELSPTSPNEDSDGALLSPVPDPEPIPGLDGVPVKCKCAFSDEISDAGLSPMTGYDVSFSTTF